MATPHGRLRRDCARNFSQRASNKSRSTSWPGQRLAAAEPGCHQRRRPSARHNPGLLSPRTTNAESPSPKSPATETICSLNPRKTRQAGHIVKTRTPADASRAVSYLSWSDGRPRPSNPLGGLMARWRIFSGLNRDCLLDSARTAFAAVLAMLLARLLEMPEYYWAPISTIVIIHSTIHPLPAGWQRF